MGIGNIADTGMRAAMSDMEIISNNIANANTIGFKRSYGTFGDIYPYGAGGGGSLQAGLGVSMRSINQDFTNGGALYTNLPLDLMINNSGFFVLKDVSSGVQSFTRAGRFQLDNEGYITNGKQRLQGFGASNGSLQVGGTLSDLQVSQTPLTATASANISINMNIDSTSAIPGGTFNNNDPSTYNYPTTTTIYDSLGNTHSLQMYYVKTATTNSWTAYAYVDGTSLGQGTVSFDSSGKISSVTGLSSLSYSPGGGANSPQVLNVDLSQCTQFATDNTTRNMTQDGYPVGTLAGYNVDPDGNLFGIYSNQKQILLGRVAIAEFQSPTGMESIGNMSWVQTSLSGSPIVNPQNSLKNIIAGQVETSNVDLTQEMISLITAQHDFQANAQVEQAYNEAIQTVIKI